MKRFRFQFSMVVLLWVMTGTAFTCVALPFASEIWASISFSLALGLLLFSMLAVLFRRDVNRAFWVGFALFGVAYLLTVSGPWSSGEFKSRLITSRILGYMHGQIAPMFEADFDVEAGTVLVDLDSDANVDLLTVGQSGSPKIYQNLGAGVFENISTVGHTMPVALGSGATLGPRWSEFQQVGHSLFTVLIAIVGGLVARLLWLSQQEADSTNSKVPNHPLSY